MTLSVYVIYLAALSLVTYVVYVSDKRKAKKGKWRIPEATLLGLSFLGGAVGGYCAMLHVRHKTKHWYFHVVHWLGLLWQTGLFAYLLRHPDWLF